MSGVHSVLKNDERKIEVEPHPRVSIVFFQKILKKSFL